MSATPVHPAPAPAAPAPTPVSQRALAPDLAHRLDLAGIRGPAEVALRRLTYRSARAGGDRSCTSGA